MATRGRWAVFGIGFGVFAMLGACGGNPEVVRHEDDSAFGGEGGSPRATGGGGGGSGGIIIGDEGGAAGAPLGGTGGSPPDCGGECSLGQRCDASADPPVCVNNECADLTCTDTEECSPAPQGGNYCASIACTSDVGCPEERYCDGTRCVDDGCEPDAQRCDANQVWVCASNGSAEVARFSCESPAYFASVCADVAESTLGCTCEDDWDCPEFTSCDAGVCRGTGVEPTCKLPPVPFEEVLPQLEFHWGGQRYARGNGADPTGDDAVDSPFPWSAQVSAVPVVANLDDDNGDGLVNELDFPEILFTSYHDDNPHAEGVVRAIHGGGPNKGRDFFALCGTTHWVEGDPLPTTGDCASEADASDANASSGGTLAVGDLDQDGLPEIVVPLENGRLEILNHRGEIITTETADLRPADSPWNYPGPALANLDHAGLPEIVVGNRVLTLSVVGGALAIDRIFSGTGTTGAQQHEGELRHHGPTVCVADLTSTPGLEFVAGTTLYRLPDPPADCAGGNATSDYCEGRLTAVWDALSVNPSIDDEQAEAFCAVADVLGADQAAAPSPANPLDGTPEVVLIANGYLIVLDGATGTVRRLEDLQGGDQGGAPNIDDFDGDGFPEIGTALRDFYRVIDLQEPSEDCPAWPDLMGAQQAPPGTNLARSPGGACTTTADCAADAVCNGIAGTCTCLHNGWTRDTEDDSSRVTSSSVFDFNGDGAAEVVYNDECYFKIYDGATGGIYLALPSMSRTLVENPVVADVDNDGNAEIVFSNNNDNVPERCSEVNLDSWPDGDNDVPRESLPNGVDVWGDPSDVWVAARRIWNQHAYHVTNVTEGGTIPVHEPESWKAFNGRVYNTYRSQPRSYGAAPDLSLTAIQISSPDAVCGQLSQQIEIVVDVKNLGDLRVGPGVLIEFFGEWSADGLTAPLNDEGGQALRLALEESLEPGASQLVSVTYAAGNNAPGVLPDSVRVIIDGGNGSVDTGAERECRTDNNEITSDVSPGEATADLRLSIDSASGCDEPVVEVTVFNDGATSASEVLVRIYAGDPSQGGTVLGEVTVPGIIQAGWSVQATVTLEPLDRDVRLFGVVDPLDVVVECNNANNEVEGPPLECRPILR